MNLTQRSTSRDNFVWRWLTAGMCAAIVLTWAAQASALTNVGPGAFSAGATKLTFENLPGDNSNIPAGYASASGVSSFSGATESEVYADYGSALVLAATGAGLGNLGLHRNLRHRVYPE